ncbi:hypothetical protein [Nostoc sp. CmiVER01]|uniref:hypothetical protein n=1 Tax=Nostoc sp. CmiVER01 TaxID=3075384 RepID=UPI003D1620AD
MSKIPHDDNFVILHHSGFIMHSEITYCTQNRRSIGEILRDLILIWEVIARRNEISTGIYLKAFICF